jgi:hypothetical protein
MQQTQAGGVEEEEVVWDENSIRLSSSNVRTSSQQSAFRARAEPTMFDIGVTPMSYTPEDRNDPAALNLTKRRACCACCQEDTFPARLWGRIKLDHVFADNSPGFVLLKIVLVCVISLLIDKGLILICVLYFQKQIKISMI